MKSIGVLKKKEEDWSYHLILAKRFISLSKKVNLAITITDIKDGTWGVLAIETDSKNMEDANKILDDHSHKIVGSYDSLNEAMKAGESFAKAWLRGSKSTKSKKCDCDDIKITRGSLNKAMKAVGVRLRKRV